jgi:adenylylsulfate kinase
MNLVRQHFDVSPADRRALMGHAPLVVWFTGLSGSGKSTLANAFAAALHQQNVHTYSLDGDNVRLGLNKDLDFSPAGRAENLRRIGEVAKLMSDAGLVVTTSFITPLRETRTWLRNTIPHYVEVFVDCPLEECERRDVKGLYAKARRGEISDFTGISAPFEAPEAPDLHLNTRQEPLDACLDRLLDTLLPRIFSPH